MHGPALIDIVIPVHDRPDWLRLCLAAIEEWTENPYRLILVDNASQEQATQDLLRNASRDRAAVLRLGRNRSFSDAVNAGVRAGNAPHVVVLNTDVLVQPGWDRHLLQDLSDVRVGLTGARTNYASGLQGHPDPELARLVEPKYLIFCCVGFRREVWDEVGALDEETCPGWGGGEDLDYSWRVQDAGYQLRVSEAYVFHGGSQTYARQVDHDEKARLEAATMIRLQAKHGAERVASAGRLLPKVALGTMSHGERTSVTFVECLLKLQKGGAFGLTPVWSRRNVVHHARQSIAELVVQQTDCTHLLFVDDDMVFPPDFVTRLLAHRKPIVGALAYQRAAPHGTCVYRWDDEGGGHVALEGIEHAGLLPVDAVGFGGVLIELDVFRRLEAPWFQFTLGPGGMGEDLYFCRRAREAGIQVYCDTDLIMGHQGAPIVVDEAYRASFREQQLQAL